MEILDNYRPPFWARGENSRGKYHHFEYHENHPQWGPCLISACHLMVKFIGWEEQEDLVVVSEIDIYPSEKCQRCLGQIYSRG